MENDLLNLLLGQGGVIAAILMWVGVLLSAAVMVIYATPTKKDDDLLSKVKSIPLLGGLMVALVEKSPLDAINKFLGK